MSALHAWLKLIIGIFFLIAIICLGKGSPSGVEFQLCESREGKGGVLGPPRMYLWTHSGEVETPRDQILKWEPEVLPILHHLLLPICEIDS